MSDQTITNLKRKLARWELDHLRQHAAELFERVERAEKERDYYRELAEFWNDEAMRMISELQDEGADIGLTKGGEIVVDASCQFIKREATLVTFTNNQSEEIRHLINAQRTYGGSVIAQVWPDGMRVCHIFDDESDKIKMTLKSNSGDQKFRSAVEAHAAAIFRNEKKGEAA